MTLTIEFNIEDEAWAEAAPWYREVALRATETALSAAGLKPQDIEVSALLCSNDRIAELNGTFREKPMPTNVLSWPAHDATLENAPAVPPDGFLGDIALARQTVETEALEQHLTVENHFAHLFAHGVLHLLGYDHETDADAEVMERLESQAMMAMGIKNPYAEA
jgi:probable rRNA maturation factor